MCKIEYELVNYTIDTDSPADQLELGVGGVVEDEAVLVEVGQLRAADATGYLARLWSDFGPVPTRRSSSMRELGDLLLERG